ncbi:MAG: transporter substrate-binding domain-containing protein [Clostridia bacterium]|nr:transporter substrate-binding domain-containing protein [Clostridia bacterium]
MKKYLALLLAALMIFALVSCGAEKAPAATGAAPAETGAAPAGEQTDSAYVTANGKLVVGITDFEPMDYQDDNGEWIGFDADLAAAFAKSLGVEVEFVEIEWDNKIMELNGKNIDCVWNGMTLTDEVKAAMETSKAYLNNAQIVVTTEENAEKAKTVDGCKELKFAVENGSAGMDMAEENGFEYTAVLSQADALMEVAAGTSDAAVIDSLMAGAMIGEGTSYENLVTAVKLNSEEYGVGFRTGSDLAAKLDEFLAANTELVNKLAKTYGVQEALIG